MMTDSRNPYRFSIRDLLLATAGLGGLLFLGKTWGVYFAGSLALTLIVGVLLIHGLRRWPISTWRAPFARCTMLTCAAIAFPFACFFLVDVLFAPWHYFWSFGGSFTAIVCLTTMLACTALMVCYGLMMMNTIRPLLSPLLLLLNFWFAKIISSILVPGYERFYDRTDVIQGYLIGLAIVALPVVVRWINRLPTTREEIPEMALEKAATLDESE